MSLYDYLSLNPSVISVGKIAWRHHAVAYFQTSCIPRLRNRRYIPTVSPTGLFRRYIPTDFETELFPSVYITDGKIPSVILLLFSGFLVVIILSNTRNEHMNSPFNRIFCQPISTEIPLPMHMLHFNLPVSLLGISYLW